MTDYEVTCITPDGPDHDRRIDGIGGSFGRRSTDRAIQDIDSPSGDRYHTNVNGNWARVHKSSKNASLI